MILNKIFKNVTLLKRKRYKKVIKSQETIITGFPSFAIKIGFVILNDRCYYRYVV